VQGAYAAIVSGQARLITELNTQIAELGEVVAAHFGRHPDADIYASQPGLGVILGARVLAEFGDDPVRFADARARKNYAGTSPITRASGRRRIVLARYARNRRLADALQQWAFCCLRGSPGAKGLLPGTTRPRHRPPGSPPPALQPARRHPARLPCQPHPLQRGHRLGTSRPVGRLTIQNMGCLPRRERVESRKAPKGRGTIDCLVRARDNTYHGLERSAGYLTGQPNPWLSSFLVSA
jgi:hypothetical protein